MKKVLRSILLFIISVTLMIGCFACGNNSVPPDGETPGDDTPKPDPDKTYVQMINDDAFNKPMNITRTGLTGDFNIGSIDLSKQTENNQILLGETLNNKLSNWRIGQWGGRYNLGEGIYSVPKENEKKYSDVGKALTFNTNSGEFTMEVKGNKEYPQRARTQGEEWTHLLLEQEPLVQKKLVDLEELWIECELTLNYVTDYMTKYPSPFEYKDGLHATQFQWIMTLQDRITPSAGGEYVWINMGLFDYRNFKTSSLSTKSSMFVDGGKESATGRPIYAMNQSSYMKETLKTRERTKILYNILPMLKDVFDEAASTISPSPFTVAKWENMSLGSMNIGWEVPGVYTSSITVHKMQMYCLEKEIVEA